MSRSAFTTLPVVDISELSSSNREERHKVAEALGRAASEVGFLYITGHGVAPSLTEELKAAARDYFSQPLDVKLSNYIGRSENHSGYVPEGEEQFAGGSRDKKEAYDIGFEYSGPDKARVLLGGNQWPDLPGFKPAVQAYYAAVLDLGRRLFQGFTLALGLEEDALASLATTPPSQLRLIHYPFNSEVAEDRPGIGAHTDYECFTVLLPTAPGLEVLNSAGEWIDVPIVKDAFVVNIGDMMEVLSNGRFVATSHRVRKVATERYSFPMFCSLDYDVVIAPIAGLQPGPGAKSYAPVKCGDHLFAQTAQTFQYLKLRVANGEIELPEGSLGLSSFGHLPERAQT
jgi:isopenicillin N synthase-like dioxygenase